MHPKTFHLPRDKQCHSRRQSLRSVFDEDVFNEIPSPTEEEETTIVGASYTSNTPLAGPSEGDLTALLHQYSKDGELLKFKERVDEEKWKLDEYRKLDLGHKHLNRVSNNCTVLHTMAKNNQLEMMRWLLEECETCFVTIDAKDIIGATPLFYAAANGSSETLNYLLARGALPNVRDCYGLFPLLLSVKNNHMQATISLLANGADVHFKTFQGDTSLHQACKVGSWETTLLLLKNRASLLRTNARKETAVFHAVRHPDLLRQLLPYIMRTPDSYKENMRVSIGGTYSTPRLETDPNLSALLKVLRWKNEDEETVVHRCVNISVGSHGVLESIEEQTVGVVSLSIILSLVAAFDQGERKKPSLLSIIKKQPATALELILNDRDRRGDTPLHVAVRNNNVPAVELLVSKPACPAFAQNETGDTPMHVAITLERYSIMDIFQGRYGNKGMKIKNLKGVSCTKLYATLKKTEPCTVEENSNELMFNHTLKRSPSFQRGM